jgi:transposase
MDSKELYTALLGLRSPWTVERVEMDLARQEVSVFVEHAPASRFRCPRCERELAVFDHAAERRWRHLDSCQFMTFLNARAPRVDCPEHGKLQTSLPWAEAGSRFTTMFEALAIDVLKAANVKRAAELLRLTWDEAWGVMDRAVRRGRAAKGHAIPQQIGVDEKAISKGQKYMTLVCDLDEATVEYVGEERTEKSLAAYFDAFMPEQRAGVEAISMDMWQPYINATLAAVPGAQNKIVFDRFHIMQHVTHALDLVRRRESKALRSEGDERLLRTRYLWLRSAENLTDAAIERFGDLRASTLKTARAWAIKENVRILWDFERQSWAEKFFRRWYFWATHSRLPPMIEVARMIKRHLHNVLTYYVHPVTNAVAESLNSKIAGIQKRACGFRNRDHFKIAIYFHCGGLNLYPSALTPGKVR